MRIISETKEDNFLLEVTSKELAGILGSNYMNSDTKEVVKGAIKTGTTIAISKIYTNYSNVVSLARDEDNYNSIEGIKKSLRNSLDDLDALVPFVKDLKETFDR